MILFAGQNPETFFDAIARHIIPGKTWTSKGTEAVSFGFYWTGVILHTEDAEGVPFDVAVRLDCDQFSEEELDMIEAGMSLLEGWDYKPGDMAMPALDDDEDDDDEKERAD